MLDGATRMRTLRDVVLPLAAPDREHGHPDVSLLLERVPLCALVHARPRPLHRSRRHHAVPRPLSGAMGPVLAATVVATIPVALLVLACQRRIVAGLTLGATKGEPWQRSRSLDSPRPIRMATSRSAISTFASTMENSWSRRALGMRQEHVASTDCRPRNAHGGRIVIGDVDVTAHPPQRRDLAMVFQSYALPAHERATTLPTG